MTNRISTRPLVALMAAALFLAACDMAVPEPENDIIVLAPAAEVIEL